MLALNLYRRQPLVGVFGEIILWLSEEIIQFD